MNTTGMGQPQDTFVSRTLPETGGDVKGIRAAVMCTKLRMLLSVESESEAARTSF